MNIFNTCLDTVILLGADEQKADKEMREMLAFETQLANVSQRQRKSPLSLRSSLMTIYQAFMAPKKYAHDIECLIYLIVIACIYIQQN